MFFSDIVSVNSLHMTCKMFVLCWLNWIPCIYIYIYILWVQKFSLKKNCNSLQKATKIYCFKVVDNLSIEAFLIIVIHHHKKHNYRKEYTKFDSKAFIPFFFLFNISAFSRWFISSLTSIWVLITVYGNNSSSKPSLRDLKTMVSITIQYSL